MKINFYFHFVIKAISHFEIEELPLWFGGGLCVGGVLFVWLGFEIVFFF